MPQKISAIVFAPIAVGDTAVSAAARVCSLPIHGYSSLQAVAEAHAGGEENMEGLLAFISERMCRLSMEIYPGSEDGFAEIIRFAKQHGLKPEITGGVQ